MVKKERSHQPSRAFLNPGQLAEHLDAFTQELRSGGYTALTVLGYTMSVAHFGQWARRSGVATRDMNHETVAEFARHRCRCPGSRQWHRVSPKYARRVRRFMRFLERRGVVEPRSCAPRPSLPEFREWLFEHRGACARTIERYEGVLLKLPLPTGRDVTRLSAAEVRRLVLHEARRHSRAQTQCIVTALRAYLRFLASTRRCAPGLDRAIPTIPQWRLSALPRFLPPNDVERVIDSCSLDTAVGLRDRAILLLLARLGLRGGDVVRMRLDDIDWQRATLKVCGKGRREFRLPLPQDVGDAVLSYLRKARPRVRIERVFLCIPAPFRPLQNSGAVSSVVSAGLRRAGVTKPPTRGANLLRHSAATAMLRAGASLQAVSSMLRHRSVDMTMHYAKVDLAMLAEVVQPWPEGVSC
jgi:site-specific recombinase XerD